MTDAHDPIPPDLRDLVAQRLDSLLRRARGQFQLAVRRAHADTARNFTSLFGTSLGIQREAAAAEELHRRARLVWDTYAEVFASAGVDDPLPLMGAVLAELPERLEAEKQDIFLTNRETLVQAGGSITLDHLDTAVRDIVEDFSHALALSALRARELATTSLVALAAPRYAVANAHWEKMKRFRSSETADLENAVKEAIMAVEALAKTILGLQAATLSDCLKDPRLSRALSPTIVALLHKLYAFTNDSPGIRHAGLTPPGVATAEATFAIESCAASLRLLLAMDTAPQAAC